MAAAWSVPVVGTTRLLHRIQYIAGGTQMQLNGYFTEGGSRDGIYHADLPEYSFIQLLCWKITLSVHGVCDSFTLSKEIWQYCGTGRGRTSTRWLDPRAPPCLLLPCRPVHLCRVTNLLCFKV